MKKIKVNKYISFFVIPVSLLIFWWISSLILNNKISFSTLVYQESAKIEQTNTGKLLRGNTISGEFIAKDNHLGILILNFKDFVKPDYRGEDVLSFKLKERGAKNWYVVNNYRSGLMEHQLQFPFGFPQIEYSKDKAYQFEIKSLLGNNSNSVELSNKDSVLTAYQYPRQEITGSKSRIITFIFKKSINSLINFDFLLSSVLYLLPFLLYILWEILIKKLEVGKQIFSVIVLLLILMDIFLLKEFYLGVFILLILLWLISIKFYKFESSVSFFLSGILIIFWILLILVDKERYFNKLNIWVFVFLLLGVIQSVLEEKGVYKPELNYKKFILRKFNK